MIRFYGANDDLIEIEGDISEEFNYYPDEDHPMHIAASDGTVIRVEFDRDSIWRFTPVIVGKARLVHTVQTLDDPDDGYSDVIHLFDDGLPDDPIRWVALVSQFARPRR
jgi:hypothetical protein